MIHRYGLYGKRNDFLTLTVTTVVSGKSRGIVCEELFAFNVHFHVEFVWDWDPNNKSLLQGGKKKQQFKKKYEKAIC